jgi:copper(I)-binding protein
MASLFLSLSLLANEIEVQEIYVRAVPPSSTNSASFMKLTNHSEKDIFLISANSNISRYVELHEHTMHDGIMKMQQIKEIKIPAKSVVILKPGGLHVMLLDLNKKLIPGEYIEYITLNFSDKTSIQITNVPIKSVMSSMKQMGH